MLEQWYFLSSLVHITGMSPKKMSGYSSKSDNNDDNGNGQDHRPGSSTDPIFTPVVEELSPEQLEALSLAFSGLSLEQQRLVAHSFEEAEKNLKAQKKMVKSVKQVDVKLKSEEKKQGKADKSEKPVSERFEGRLVRLRLRCPDGSFKDLEMHTNQRRGTLRQEICRIMNYKTKQPLNICINGVMISDSHTVFLYTLKVKDGDEVSFELPPDGATQENVNTEADDLAVPLGEAVGAQQDVNNDKPVSGNTPLGTADLVNENEQDEQDEQEESVDDNTEVDEMDSEEQQ